MKSQGNDEDEEEVGVVRPFVFENRAFVTGFAK